MTVVTMEDVSPPSPPPPAQIGEVAVATEQAASSAPTAASCPPPSSRKIKPMAPTLLSALALIWLRFLTSEGDHTPESLWA